MLCTSLQAGDELVSIVTSNRTDGSIAFYSDNRYLAPVWLTVEIPKLVNLSANRSLPFSAAVPAGSDGEYLFTLKPIRQAPVSYSYRYRYILGDPSTAIHNDNHLYFFPFAHGTKHKVAQGYHGRFTHFDENEYALDFDLLEGTPVTAARNGLVVEVKEDSSVGGPTANYEDLANYIRIYQEDGSFATYTHLRLDGAAVEPGQRVLAGLLIGYSGSTGRATGPHLHFDVRIPTYEGKLDTIPTLFLSHDGSAVSPEEGLYYYATHPGQPAYPVLLGRNITNKDYDDYREEIQQFDSLELRTERLDDTVLVFARNGFGSEQKITVELSLENMQASQDLPFTTIIPSLSEVFLFLLRPDKRDRGWQYSYRYWYREPR